MYKFTTNENGKLTISVPIPARTMATLPSFYAVPLFKKHSNLISAILVVNDVSGQGFESN